MSGTRTGRWKNEVDFYLLSDDVNHVVTGPGFQVAVQGPSSKPTATTVFKRLFKQKCTISVEFLFDLFPHSITQETQHKSRGSVSEESALLLEQQPIQIFCG